MTKTTRRRLLARAGKVCVGIAAGAAGLSSVAQARADGGSRSVGCCRSPITTTARTALAAATTAAPAVTRWAWYCVDNARRIWICGECYTGGSCSGCSCGRIAVTQGSHAVPRVKGWRQ